MFVRKTSLARESPTAPCTSRSPPQTGPAVRPWPRDVASGSVHKTPRLAPALFYINSDCPPSPPARMQTQSPEVYRRGPHVHLGAGCLLPVVTCCKVPAPRATCKVAARCAEPLSEVLPARPLRGALLTHHVSVGSYHVHSKLQEHKALCQAAHFPEPSCGQSARPSHAGLPHVPCNCKPTRAQGLGLQGPSPELRFAEPVLTLLTASRCVVTGRLSSLRRPPNPQEPRGHLLAHHHLNSPTVIPT